jgi:hypothetical protein
MTPDELKRRGWEYDDRRATWSHANYNDSKWSDVWAEEIESFADARLREFWDWAMTEVANGRHAGHGDPVEAFYASREKNDE